MGTGKCMLETYLGVGAPNSKVKDPWGEAGLAMAVTGVVRFKLGKCRMSQILFHHILNSKSARGIKIVLSVCMKKPRKRHLWADKKAGHFDSINNQTTRSPELVKNTNVFEASPGDCGRFARWGNNGMHRFLLDSPSSDTGTEYSCWCGRSNWSEYKAV